MTDTDHGKLASLLAHNKAFIPGGVSSTNRIIDPAIAFTRADGAYLWDIDGKRYVDYHAAFAPYLLGHNFAPVNEAVIAVLRQGESLYGAGPAVLEGKLAELVCSNIPGVEKAEVGPRVSPGEYPLCPLGAGTTLLSNHFVHPVNFNDLESVRYVCRRYPIAAMITEPVLQNIGVVRPQPGYLSGLRELADEFGFLLIFDEVKTGFRHSLGGYGEISGVRPDLVTYGKAIANGFPLAVVGGQARYMDYVVHADSRRRPLVAGTYNGHPVAVAAAIATIEYLLAHRGSLYAYLEQLGSQMEAGLRTIFASHGITASIARQGSAFSFYLMPTAPTDFHGIIEQHDFDRDLRLRRALNELGVFFVPIATKQCSISAAHTAEDIQFTLTQFERAVGQVWSDEPSMA